MTTHPSHHCPQCGTALPTGAAAAARARTCPGCGTVLLAPAGAARSPGLAPTVCRKCWSHIGLGTKNDGRCPNCQQPLL